MPRVTLEILRGPYQPALAAGFRVESCRLLTELSIRCSPGWTPFRPAIIDTGAPVSLLPQRVWQAADARVIGKIRIAGIARKPECMLDATLAVVTLAIRDQASQIMPLDAYAVLADGNDVPTLLGMRGVLMDLILHTNIASGEAYLETRP